MEVPVRSTVDATTPSARQPVAGTLAATLGATMGVSVAVASGPTAPSAFETEAPACGPGESGPLSVGQAFGPRYHIIRLLGAGGMGAVYQAWDADLGVAVALKVIRAEQRSGRSADVEKRFKQELLLARQVTHKNVVRIHDLGEIDGIKYLTMPYVKGDDLATVLRRDRRLPLADALIVARQVAAGLQAAHEAGVVHRDLKPANIMVSGAGRERHALIMDFGISASADAAQSGAVVGTLDYMAPEQAKGYADVRADIYAFGLILYEMLVGFCTNPDAAPQARVEAMKQRTTEGLVPIRLLDRSIPEALAALVMTCVALDPDQRFQNAGELNAALARLDAAGQQIPIARRLTKQMLAAAALAVVLLVAGAFYAARRLTMPAKPHDPVSVVIADFRNGTSDPAFDRTLEPMLRRALEGAGFINAYDRTRIRPTFGVRPPDDLDGTAARQLALTQGLGVVLTGSIAGQPGAYEVSIRAAQAATGNIITDVRARAARKADVLGVAAKLVASVRKALGDRTSSSDQLFARSISATSLEVVKYYTAAIDALSNGRYDAAEQNLLQTVKLDPNFGLGYQGLAVVSRNLGRLQDANGYIKEALRHLDGMSERERLGTRGLYYRMTGDYQECVKEYGELIARYAADVGGHNQRALCSSKLRDMRGAVEEMRQVVHLVPNRVIYRDNLALYLAYAGDFQGAEQEARNIREPDVYARLALAFAQTGQGRLDDAAATYRSMQTMGALGASFASAGRGDLALYRGRYSDATRIFEAGAAADLAAGNPDRAARKLTSLAYSRLARGRASEALAAADHALAYSQAIPVRFLASRIFAAAGAVGKARTTAAALAAELAAEPQAYGKIVNGDIALETGDPRGAIKILTEANTVLDTWIGHFDLGRAYLAAGALTQADSEFDRCIGRRGEALALLVDEEPTSGVFPPVYDYQGRVREALGTAAFANAYRAYLAIRGGSTEDPRLPEIRRRAGLQR